MLGEPVGSLYVNVPLTIVPYGSPNVANLTADNCTDNDFLQLSRVFHPLKVWNRALNAGNPVDIFAGFVAILTPPAKLRL